MKLTFCKKKLSKIGITKNKFSNYVTIKLTWFFYLVTFTFNLKLNTFISTLCYYSRNFLAKYLFKVLKLISLYKLRFVSQFINYVYIELKNFFKMFSKLWFFASSYQTSRDYCLFLVVFPIISFHRVLSWRLLLGPSILYLTFIMLENICRNTAYLSNRHYLITNLILIHSKRTFFIIE